MKLTLAAFFYFLTLDVRGVICLPSASFFQQGNPEESNLEEAASPFPHETQPINAVSDEGPIRQDPLQRALAWQQSYYFQLSKETHKRGCFPFGRCFFRSKKGRISEELKQFAKNLFHWSLNRNNGKLNKTKVLVLMRHAEMP